MRLTLTTFGVYTKRTFEFPDTGLILISGPSGKGKTTIYRAINYALTGEGTKLPTHGHVKCAVTLEYKHMTITRTNRPCRVVLKLDGVTYENDEAQSMIYQTIGNHFGIAGYIKQKGESSFLGMTPAEKLRFLEKVVFSNIPIDEIKEKSRRKVSELEIGLARLQGEFSSLQNIDHPGIFPKTYLQIQSQKTSYKNTRELLTATEDRLNRQILSDTQTIQKRNSLDKQLRDIRIQPVQEKIDSGDAEKNLQIYIAYEKYMQSQKQIQDLQQNYIQPHQREIDIQIAVPEPFDSTELDSLRKDLLQYTKQQDIQTKKDAFKRERYEELLIIVPELESNLTTYLLGKEAKICPGCKTSLRICQSNLQLYTGSKYFIEVEKEMREKLAILRKELKELEFAKKIADAQPELTELIELDPTEVEARINELVVEEKKYQDSNKIFQELTRKLELARNNPAIRKAKEQIQALSKIEKVDKPLESKASLEKLISDKNIRDRDIIRITKENAILTEKKLSLQKELDSLPKCDNIEKLQKELADIRDQLKGNHEDQLLLAKVESDFSIHTQKMAEYNKYILNKTRIQEQLTNIERKYTLSKKFRDAIVTAEMLTISALIEEINTHLASYLNVFFPDNPITIDLRLFKANEKTKVVRNQVNIQVGYRGSITDLTSLSGGEMDRVHIAFTLALAEIFNVPLLMIDETLSSLDREACESIVEHINKEGKCIMIIAHQISHGLFDHVFEV